MSWSFSRKEGLRYTNGEGELVIIPREEVLVIQLIDSDLKTSFIYKVGEASVNAILLNEHKVPW